MFEHHSAPRPEDADRVMLYPMFAPELEVKPVLGEGGKRRFSLYHPRRDTTCVLGEAELTVAKLFDGQRSLQDVAACALTDHRLRLSVAQLQRFEERLRRLRLLESAVEEPPGDDPLSGAHYGKLSSAIMIRLFSTNPDEAFEKLLGRLPFLARRGFFMGCLAVVIAGAAALGLHWGAFWADAPWPPRGVDWLILYLLVGLQGVFHEGGHALACKAFGVRIHEIGLGIYLFVLTAWTRPIQHQWDRLTKRERLVTIVLGPFGSLVFGALGVLLWRWSPHGSFPSRIGLLAALSTPVGTVPTMIPLFNGDGYLLLTEYFDKPGLRQRSWSYLRDRLAGKAEKKRANLPLAEQRLYLFVSIGTVVGLATVWVTLFGLIVYVAARELSSTVTGGPL